MKKLLILLSLFVMLPVMAQTLRAGIEYTVDSARQIAFDDIQYHIDKDKYINPYIVDINYKENKRALKYGYTLGDRDLEQLKAKGLTAYAVTYRADPFVTYYYWGRFLIGVDINEQERKTVYPFRSFYYNTDGDLLTVTVNVAHGDNYVYNKNKNLVAHCKDDYCYNNSGKIIGTRKNIESYN